MQALLINEPYLVFYPDRVVLRPSECFISKVLSAFHFKLRHKPTNLPRQSRRATSLDKKSTINAYLSATGSFRKTDNLFYYASWSQEGSKSVNTHDPIMAIKKKAYSVQQLPIPDGLKAYSTRAVATSRAAYCRVSPETICKAATWFIEKHIYGTL